MKGLENEGYLIAYIISNVVAVVLVLLSVKRPAIARILFFLLFAWASWVNWRTALYAPQNYIDYASLSFSHWYRQFITGWFSNHVLQVVGFIATAQACIAVAMLLKGIVYKTGIVGGIIFLLAILPLGVGAAFPATLIMAIAMLLLWKQYPWAINEKNVFKGIKSTGHDKAIS